MAAATFAGTTKAVAAEFCVEPVISNSGTEAVACRSRRKEYKAAEEWEEVRGGGEGGRFCVTPLRDTFYMPLAWIDLE